MKVFFNASLAGKRQFERNYALIHEAIEKAGHEMIASPVMINEAEKVILDDAEEAGSYYQRLQKWIKQAEICVFDVSYPSTSIGHEVALALHLGKPVVTLHVKSAPKNLVLESLDDDKLQLVDYTEDTVDELVDEAIGFATEQVDTRFNFFISPEIGAYLDFVARERKLPRAVFLRQLIEDDMKEQGYDG
jgi:hypothetical protein